MTVAAIMTLDKIHAGIPLYQQIANHLILHIRRGTLPKGYRLPGSRQLAKQLGVQRGTVNAAYDELVIQGWVKAMPRSGFFVRNNLPDVSPQHWRQEDTEALPYPETTAYGLQQMDHLQLPLIKGLPGLAFNDGFPDLRLAPVQALGSHLRSIMLKPVYRRLLSYGNVEGNDALRVELSQYLNETRGLNTTPAHIFITRGSQMGIFLLAQTILRPGDNVIVGQTNYHVANASFVHAGANLFRVPVDKQGIDVDAIAQLCAQQPVRAVYVTSHHHYPTTVTLGADRRINLLALARKYGFAIIEDDYHYDFHYDSNPILPLASADTDGHVAYIGSFSKCIAPAFRVGYIVAPPNLLQVMGRLRRIIDRQGDSLLEQAVADLLKEGEIQRHLKKVRKIYQDRRDAFCRQLHDVLGDAVVFDPPAGGLAVWAGFDPAISLPRVAARASKSGLYVSDGTVYNPPGINLNSARLGFAALAPEEMKQAIQILKESLQP